jgi:hypothetical protein
MLFGLLEVALPSMSEAKRAWTFLITLVWMPRKKILLNATVVHRGTCCLEAAAWPHSELGIVL